MAAPLRTASIQAPAFFGLNTMDSEVTLNPKFARIAENCVIDEGGRIGARKGWQYIAQTNPVSQIDLKGLHRFIDIAGVEYFGCWSDTAFYVKSGGTLNQVTYTGGNTLTDGNWQATTLNDAAYLFQRGYDPIYFNPNTSQLDDVDNATNTATVSISNGGSAAIINSATVTITHSGTVATVTHTAHGFTTGDTVVISGADQTDYNGTFTITVNTSDEYEYTMSNSPSVDATGTITAYGKIATATRADHKFNTGDSVLIAGATPTAYNGTFTITKIDDDTFKYTMASTPSADASGSVSARGTLAVVTDVAHDVFTGDSVTFTNATPTGYNGTFTITVLDADTYTYTLASIETTDAFNVTASWYKGTPPQANTVLSAYGRLWCADTPNNKTTVYWSDLLDGTEWRSNVGTVGSLDISGILINGNDEIVSLGAHNGYLIIFCKNNIIIMGDTDANKKYLAPNDLQLVEVINGVGCVARDSVVNTGTDIFFLSEAGVRSLGRTIQEKSQPVRDISRNIRDTLVEQVARADETKIRAVYSDSNAFYLLAIPDDNAVWCFDMRAPLENGAARVTSWTELDHTGWLAFDGEVYMTNTHGMAQYYGYQDNGGKYSMQYYTNYFDFEMGNLVKIAKNVAATVIGSTGQKFIAKLGTDYKDIYSSYNLTVKQGTSYDYGVAEYGLNTTAAATQGASTVTVEHSQPTITGATQANPCVITSTGHSLTTGDEVFIDNVVGMVSLNGNKYTVNVLTANTFELVGIDSTAYAAYTSGGDLTHLDSYTVNFTTAATTGYDTAYKVWLDADGFYYAYDNGSRTVTYLYTPATDWFAEYSGASLIENIRIPVGGAGFVIQLGFESEIDGGFLNIQQIDLYVKQGRLN